MKLYCSATYQPNEDEVWVDFRSTEDDDSTISIADSLELNLLIETKDSIGSISYLPLSRLDITKDYIRPDKNYEVIFRNPLRKMDLWIEVSATFGSTVVKKRVVCGQALPSHTQMELPDNVLYGRDIFDMTETGSDHYIPNENIVTLAPEIRDYLKKYDFTYHQAVEDFEGLTYLGGGNRLWIHNQTNQFELQSLDQPFWELSSFAFMEPSTFNLVPNPFFMNVVNANSNSTAQPAGFIVDSAGSLLNQTVDFDYQITAGAKIWNMRFLQSNDSTSFKEASIALENTIQCLEETPYTFSVYTRVKPLSAATRVSKLNLILRWYQDAVLLSEEQVSYDTNDFKDFNMASITRTAPLNANAVLPVLKLGSIDGGDDVLLSLLGYQLEEGFYPTTRTLGERVQDTLQIDSYNATNQKVRCEFIVGFNSGRDITFLEGDLIANFKSTEELEIVIPEAETTLTLPFTFVAGDFLDITIEHQSGKRLAVFRNGQFLADTSLPVFTSSLNPLTFLGVGVELIRLSVFSRRGD